MLYSLFIRLNLLFQKLERRLQIREPDALAVGNMDETHPPYLRAGLAFGPQAQNVRLNGAPSAIREATLVLRCLGPLEIQLGRRALAGFDTRKALALLVYLACHAGLAFPRERLQSLLWGDSPPDRAARNLRQALVNLRRVLPGEFLIITRGSVAS